MSKSLKAARKAILRQRKQSKPFVIVAVYGKVVVDRNIVPVGRVKSGR